MIISEDGSVTGSVDVSKLGELKPKTDEAKAQVQALKAEVERGREQANADSERLNAGALEANPLADEASADTRDEQGKESGDSDSSGAKAPAKRAASSGKES